MAGSSPTRCRLGAQREGATRAALDHRALHGEGSAADRLRLYDHLSPDLTTLQARFGETLSTSHYLPNVAYDFGHIDSNTMLFDVTYGLSDRMAVTVGFRS